MVGGICTLRRNKIPFPYIEDRTRSVLWNKTNVLFEFELYLALELYPLLWVWKYPFGG